MSNPNRVTNTVQHNTDASAQSTKTKNHSQRALGCGCMSVVFGFIVIIIVAASAYMLNFALRPDKNKGRDDYNGQFAKMEKRYPWIKPWVDSLRTNHAIRDTFVMAADGDRHHAIIIKAPVQKQLKAHKGIASPLPKGEGSAVLIPGYTDCAIDMLHFGYIYNKLLGMNLLIPDLHGNGKSDGKAMQMGWKDREDVLQWIAIADSLFAGADGHASIVVHGVSMGAATTMNVAGAIQNSKIKNQNPDNPKLQAKLNADVKCFVEDCGYTSVWDEFGYELGEEFGLPEFPLLYSASALCKLKYGWTFGEASPLKQVARCTKPMLFIHGGNDTYVLTRMVYPLYNAKPAPKYLVVYHGSIHARSYCDHHVDYERRIKAFVERYM